MLPACDALIICWSNFKSKLHQSATYIGFIQTCHEIIVTIWTTFAYIKIQQKKLPLCMLNSVFLKLKYLRWFPFTPQAPKDIFLHLKLPSSRPLFAKTWTNNNTFAYWWYCLYFSMSVFKLQGCHESWIFPEFIFSWGFPFTSRQPPLLQRACANDPSHVWEYKRKKWKGDNHINEMNKGGFR